MKVSRGILSGSSAIALLAMSAGVASADGYATRTVAGVVSEVPVAYQWEGLSVGLGLGVGTMNADISGSGSRNDEIGSCNPANCEGTFLPFIGLEQRNSFDLSDSGDAGIFGTVQLGYDWKLRDRWVVGAFVDADWGSDIGADSKQTNAVNLNFFGTPVPLLNSSVKSEVEQEWALTVGGRVGLLATPGTLLYVLAGYTHVELDDAHVKVNFADPLGGFIPAIDSPTSLKVRLPDSLDGYTLGAGIETKLTRALSLKFEYRYTELDGESEAVSKTKVQCCDSYYGYVARRIQENAKADLDVDIHSVRAVLSYKFGRDEPLPATPLK